MKCITWAKSSNCCEWDCKNETLGRAQKWSRLGWCWLHRKRPFRTCWYDNWQWARHLAKSAPLAMQLTASRKGMWQKMRQILKRCQLHSVLLRVSSESLGQPVMQVLHFLCTQSSHVKCRALSVKPAQYYFLGIVLKILSVCIFGVLKFSSLPTCKIHLPSPSSSLHDRKQNQCTFGLVKPKYSGKNQFSCFILVIEGWK